MVSTSSTCLCIYMDNGIFSILDANSSTFLPRLSRPSQKGKRWSQYKIGVALSTNLYGPIVFNTNFWEIPYFLLDLNLFLNTTRYPVSNALLRLPLLWSSLFLSLLSETRILNNYLFVNRIGDVASKWSKDCYLYEAPSLDLACDRSIINSNFMPIATNDWSMAVPYNGLKFQLYSENNIPCNHLWRLPFSSEFIFYSLF